MTLPSTDSASTSGSAAPDSEDGPGRAMGSSTTASAQGGGVASSAGSNPVEGAGSAPTESASAEGEGRSDVQNDGQDDLPPLPPPSGKSLLVGNILALAFLAWIFKDPFIQGLHQGDSAFMGTLYKVSLPFCALCLAIPAALAIACLVQLVRKGFDPHGRIWRLPPIAVVVAVSAQLLFVRAFEMPQFPPTMVIATAISSKFGEPLRTPDGLLPTQPKAYADILAEAPPPFWKDGLKLTRWNAVVTEGCEGPDMEMPSMVEPGTILVCLAPDKAHGWIVAVGLSHDVVGAPHLVSINGKPLAMPISAKKTSSLRPKMEAQSPVHADSLPASSASPSADGDAPAVEVPEGKGQGQGQGDGDSRPSVPSSEG